MIIYQCDSFLFFFFFTNSVPTGTVNNSIKNERKPMIRKCKLISTYMIVINKTLKQKDISYRDSSRRERNDVNFVILKRRAYLKRE